MKKMDKKTIFYTATKVGKNRNLELFSKQVVDRKRQIIRRYL